MRLTLDPMFLSGNVGIGLVLSETVAEQSMCFAGVIAAHKVRSHVVRGTKGTRESKASTGGKTRDLIKGDKGRPQDDGVAVIVDTATTRTTSQLRVLRWSEELVAITCELREFVDNDGPCWHVDAKSERLCCENDPNESFDETLFDGLFERRNETSMMTSYTSLEGINPTAIVEYPEILICKFLDMRFCDFSDSSTFLGCRKAKTCTCARSHSFVATVSAEHKEDRWEHRALSEKLDHFNSSWC